MKAWFGASGLAALLAQAVPAAACPLGPTDGSLVQQGGVQLAWRSTPAAIANGQPFSLLVRVCPAGAQLLRVDATMPAHRHGMNYKPTLQPLGAEQGASRWQVDGMLWHMAGRWELRWDLVHEGHAVTLRQSVALR